ncbi:MAG TPA: hypothetical protein VFV76_05360, partial [Actinomycetes bacterium]|nr:hypothetical protein [Actinomycetes bacterium]
MHASRVARHVAIVLSGLLAAGTVTASPAAAAPGKPTPTPTPVVTSQPANPTGERYATFTWTPAPSTAYTCSLDGMAPTTCSGGQQVYGPLTDGVHSFSLRAKLTGKSKPSTYRYSWRVAGTPPGAPTVAPVSSPTSSTTVSVSFSNTDPAAVSHECSLDGAAFAACSSPHVVSATVEGAHTVDVRAVNAFGTTSTPASVSWVLDSTAPANVTLAGPSGYTSDTAPVVTFSADGATSYDCSVDGGTPVSCTSPYTVPGVGVDGAHSLTVRAFDAVGNAAQPATALWVLDTTPPAKPLIVTGPADRTNQTTATFEVWSDDSGILECALDGGPWQACTSPVQYSGLGAGSHTLQVRGQDAVGNISDVDSATWVIDTTAPIPPVITDGPTSPSSNTQPLFTFDTDDTSVVSFTCSLDGQTAVDCVSDVWPFGPLTADGLHTFRVVAVDAVGNLSGAASWSWILDTTAPPVPVFTSKPAASGTDTTAVFAFTAEPGAG